VPPKNPRPGRSLAILVSAGILLLAVPSGWPGSLSENPPAGASQAPPSPPVPAADPGIISTGSAVRGGPPPDLVLFYAGEVMGWTEPCG
jgi:hypothetical protein